MHFDKITARIMKLSYGLNPDFCDPVSFAAQIQTDAAKHAHAESATRSGTAGGDAQCLAGITTLPLDAGLVPSASSVACAARFRFQNHAPG